jgi:hypothetical protein
VREGEAMATKPRIDCAEKLGLMRPRIHFVETRGLMQSLGPSSPEWESGYWYRIGKKNADALIGGGIYFHKAQAEPSYCGGIITGYRIEHQGEFRGRYVFTYRPSPKFRGVSACTDGWTFRFKKLVW